METKRIGFFEEAEGVKSSTRLFCFLLLIIFFVINGMYFYDIAFADGKIDVNFIVFDTLMLIGVFAPKYLHKLAELAITKSK